MITITDDDFTAFSRYIKTHYGINLKPEKMSLVAGRLHHVIASNKMNSLSEYLNYVQTDRSGQAAVTLLNKITTNHTFFMRESDHFYYFRDSVLPYLARTIASKDMRIWSAACSSGEEPYTLAMLIDEYFGRGKAGWDTKILATDISSHVLDIAKRGIYSNEKIAILPPVWKMSYFKAYDADSSILTDDIRDEVIFRKLNLMDPVFPFRKKFHVVFCKNVMIYFDRATRRELVDKLYELTEHGGYLFIGHSESLDRDKTKYKYVRPGVFRKE
ncbi:CheR family methyltransferase [Gorillibacterium massiliense]|uniref:CheR family methyltransferase n=1 Tax=Gorillibacterium massiliense TaxID=1280390 RepID=UPI0004B4760E|nr:protein-glutamate O-methyltransferase CheR [Gorillibacterium massiliense]